MRWKGQQWIQNILVMEVILTIWNSTAAIQTIFSTQTPELFIWKSLRKNVHGDLKSKVLLFYNLYKL